MSKEYERYQAKKTWYAGTWYDSNLEARVAEAMDKLGYAYEYHRQCFRDAGFPYGQYTPDFHLPNGDVYIEVAGALDERHMSNVTTFARLFDSGRFGSTKIVTIDGDGNTCEWRITSSGVVRYLWYWKLNDPKGNNIFDVAGMKRW